LRKVSNLEKLTLTDDEMRAALSIQNKEKETVLVTMARCSDSQNQVTLFYKLFEFAKKLNWDFTEGFGGAGLYYVYENVKFPKNARDEFFEAIKKSFYQRAQNCLASLFECKNLSVGLDTMKLHYQENNKLSPEDFIQFCKEEVIRRGKSWKRTQETKDVYAAITGLNFEKDINNYIENYDNITCLLYNLENAVSKFKKPNLKAPDLFLSIDYPSKLQTEKKHSDSTMNISPEQNEKSISDDLTNNELEEDFVFI
jgi:hypothetical protein